MAVLNKRAIVTAIEMYGVTAIRLPSTLGTNLNQIIKSLFANNEQGFAYDPNDLSTMFQDAAGTIPVTAAGQPVGLMLDKSKGLALGAELVVDSEFNDATKWVLTAGALVSGGKLNVTASVGGSARQNFALKQAGTYKVTLKVDSASGSYYTVRLHNDGSIASTFVYTSGVGTKSWIITATSPFNALVLQFGSGSGLTAVFDSLSVVELKGNHAYQTTSASRPILRKNAVTGANYLEFDGTDDFLVTNSINFTGTGKVSLLVGVRKLVDGSYGAIAELSSSSDTSPNGLSFFSSSFQGFALQTGSPPDRTFGTVPMLASAPISICVAAQYDRAKSDVSEIKVRYNSGAYSSNGLSLEGASATGNFGNHPLYIGRRGGVSLPFNGHIYSLIGIGRLTTDAETTALEKLIAKNTGVTLNV